MKLISQYIAGKLQDINILIRKLIGESSDISLRLTNACLFLTSVMAAVSILGILSLHYHLSSFLSFPLAILAGVFILKIYRHAIQAFYHIPQNIFFSTNRITLLLIICLCSLFLFILICVPIELYVFEMEIAARIAQENLTAQELQLSGTNNYPPLIDLIEKYNDLSLRTGTERYFRTSSYLLRAHPGSAQLLLLLQIFIGIILFLPPAILILQPLQHKKLHSSQQEKHKEALEEIPLSTKERSEEYAENLHLDMELLHAHLKGSLDPKYEALLKGYLKYHPIDREILQGMELFQSLESISKEKNKQELDAQWQKQILRKIQKENKAD